MVRFYINGTAGQKDGTEVTEINPIIAAGLFPSGSTAASKSVKVYVRADAGESDNQVMIGADGAKYSDCHITGNNNIVQTIYPPPNWRCYILKSVTDVNQELTFTFYAKASETSTIDTSINIYAYIVDLIGLVK